MHCIIVDCYSGWAIHHLSVKSLWFFVYDFKIKAFLHGTVPSLTVNLGC